MSWQALVVSGLAVFAVAYFLASLTPRKRTVCHASREPKPFVIGEPSALLAKHSKALDAALTAAAAVQLRAQHLRHDKRAMTMHGGQESFLIPTKEAADILLSLERAAVALNSLSIISEQIIAEAGERESAP